MAKLFQPVAIKVSSLVGISRGKSDLTQGEKIADVKDAWVMCLAWPKDDHGAGISAFWSEQLNEDAPDLPAQIADAFYAARSSKQKTSRAELLRELSQLQKVQNDHHTEKQQITTKSKKKIKALKDANSALEATIARLQEKIGRNIAARGNGFESGNSTESPDGSSSGEESEGEIGGGGGVVGDEEEVVASGLDGTID